MNSEVLLQFEFQILNWIQDHLACKFLDVIIPWITFLGNGGVCWILLALLLIGTKKYRANGIVMLLALAVGALIGNLTLKPLVARARPCWLVNVPLLIKNPSDFSFPSGHALSSIIGSICLAYANRKFGAIAIPFAILIAFTRLYLYVHFPTDVVAGILLGIAVGLLMQKTASPIQKLINRLSYPKSKKH